jgi:hypothetical protein
MLHHLQVTEFFFDVYTSQWRRPDFTEAAQTIPQVCTCTSVWCFLHVWKRVCVCVCACACICVCVHVHVLTCLCKQFVSSYMIVWAASLMPLGTEMELMSSVWTPEFRFLRCSTKWDVLTFCFFPVSASLLHSFYSLENTLFSLLPPLPHLFSLF